MLLTITTSHRPASDLGFLLHKHPERFQSFDLSFGRAHVFYPELSPERCSACLLLDVDSVGIVRGKSASANFLLAQYVNDRPYAASSFLSVALAQVFGSALQGRCKDRPELAATAIPLSARIDVLPVRGGERFLRRVFEPLGYQVEAARYPLDEQFPEWGESPYYTVTIHHTTTLADLLAHLYVLVPVFDGHKHYFVGDDEMEKLLARGEGWLAQHPEKEEIARRYLKFQPSLFREALARLVQEEEPLEGDPDDRPAEKPEDALETPLRLNDQRLGAVLAALRASGARRVLDLGCGEGRLVRELLQDRQFEQVIGMDVSIRALEAAQKRLRLDRLPASQTDRIRLIHGSLMYRDRRLEGFDAAAVVEVVEHLDPPRLSAFERVLFEYARPGVIVLTTPNREYNLMWETLPAGRFRHPDHRFEWTRAEFQDWAKGIASRFGYAVRFVSVGPEHATLGTPTQMAVFLRNGTCGCGTLTRGARVGGSSADLTGHEARRARQSPATRFWEGMAMTADTRLRLPEIEQRVCDVASENLGLCRERLSPSDSIIEDLGIDSLDLVEFVMAVEEAFGVTLPDDTPNPVYKAVFTRQPFRLSDLAEMVFLQQGRGGPDPSRWGQAKEEPQTAISVPFTQLDGRWQRRGTNCPGLLEPLKTDGPLSQYRRRSDGMRCLLIPSAEVDIGCDAPDALLDERPRHVVEVDSFLMDAEPVSTTAYCRFLNSVSETTPAVLADWFVLHSEDDRNAHMPVARAEAEWRPVRGAERWPMILVSWYGANAYSLWANGKDWQRYRDNEGAETFLPTEAQWEYAARGARYQPFPWGDAPPSQLRMRYGQHRRSVRYQADGLPMADVNDLLGLSPFGLHHMAGNVWQWCRDWYDEGFYQRAEARRANPVNRTPTQVRSERGGSWVGPAELCRSSYRRGRPPLARGRCLGFRCTSATNNAL